MRGNASHGRRHAIARIGALVLLAATLPGAGPAGAQTAPAASADQAVRAAIVAAVQARLGADAAVTIAKLSEQTTTADGLIAVPEPGARIGRAIRFTLQVPDTASAWQPFRQVGTASADVHVSLPHVEAAHLVARGTLLQKQDLQVSQSGIDDVPFAPLPMAQDLVGARAVRDLQPGAILTSAVVVVPPLVQSGDTVIVHVRFPGGEVTGRATASQSGTRGELIRLVNPSSGRALQGRVIGRDEVEVVR